MILCICAGNPFQYNTAISMVAELIDIPLYISFFILSRILQLTLLQIFFLELHFDI